MKQKRQWILAAILTLWCSSATESWAQLQRTEDFHSRYTLTEAVVLSRHNIRSPLSGPESALGRITPHEWFDWSSAPSELSLRGGVLETMMGQYFRKWLVDEGLMKENETPAEGTIRFYANSMQRTIATAQYFSSGMLPVANIAIEHHYDVGTMDPVFTPQLTTVSDDYRERALQQIAELFGNGEMAGIGQKMSASYSLLEQVLDISRSMACQQGDTCNFKTDDTVVKLELNKEPGMTGGLKLACSAADALVLQYYEEPDKQKAAFGENLNEEDWKKLASILSRYGEVLFTAPLIAVNAAHPLLQEMLTELQTEGRHFTFLCGHDSNIASVLAALGVSDYELKGAIEQKTPIGCKLVVEKWLGTDGKEYAALNLCYQSVDQLRQLQLLTLENPPAVYSLRLEGLTANDDGLYLLSDLKKRLQERIDEYNSLTTGITTTRQEVASPIKT
jgi:glucose-1-phosphatase